MFQRKNLIILAIITAIAAVFLYYTLDHGLKPERKDGENIDYLTLTNNFTQLIEKRWEWGDLEGLYAKKRLNCPEMIQYTKEVGKSYLQCNPRYIECFFKQPLLKDEYSLNLDKVNSYQPVAMTFSIHRADQKIHSFKVNLERKCHETLLNESQYLIESLEGKYWSNKGRKIYLDKFLVTNNDISMWRNETTDLKKAGLPALNLSLAEMKQYCEIQNKKLMKAHIFEAAIRLKPSTKLSPYPWNHYSQSSKQGLVKARVNKDACRRSYLKECQKSFLWSSFDTDSVSWSGIHDVLGGPPEIFDNIQSPDQIYKMADWHTSFRHRNARIGFKSKLIGNQVAFRCYREEL